jgi:mRNA interferase HigB
MARAHPDVRSAVDSWIAEVSEARWSSPVDVKARYPSASILESNRVIFNLRGNNYRVDTTIAYKTSIVVVNRAGTHAEYSKWKF